MVEALDVGDNNKSAAKDKPPVAGSPFYFMHLRGPNGCGACWATLS